MQLADGKFLFLLGTGGTETSAAELEGVVLEDGLGNLILMEEVPADGIVRVTIATGDAIEYDVSGPNPKITLTLNATVPPSIVVFNVDAQGEASLDDDATVFEDALNEAYNTGPSTLPRADSSAISILPADPRAAQLGLDDAVCLITAFGDFAAGPLCTIWTAFTGFVTERLKEALCFIGQVAIDEARGTNRFPGPGPDVDPSYEYGNLLGLDSLHD